jgi:hypothetical protein
VLAAAAAALALLRGRWLVAPALALLAAMELLALHLPANPAAPAAFAFPPRPALAALAATAPPPSRVAVVGDALPPNAAAVLGLASAAAHNPMEPATCDSALDPLEELAAADLAAPATRRLLRRAAAGAVLAPPAAPVPPGWLLVHDGSGGRVVIPPWRPALVTVTARGGGDGRPEPPAPRWRLLPDRLTVGLPAPPAASAGDGGLRVLAAVCQDGGWRSLADGRPLPAEAASDAGEPWVGVAVPAGARRLEIVYRAPGFLAGMSGAAVALAVALVAWAPAPSARGATPRR